MKVPLLGASCVKIHFPSPPGLFKLTERPNRERQKSPLSRLEGGASTWEPELVIWVWGFEGPQLGLKSNGLVVTSESVQTQFG